MNKYLIRAALIVALSFCLAITTYADPTASVGDSGVSFSIATSQEDFKYSGHYAYGVRMGLYDAESGDLIKSSNWLNTDPVEPSHALGSNVKYSSKNYVSWDSMFDYSLASGLPATGSGASAKEWAKKEATLQNMCEVFGTTPEDFQSGKYVIGIEPIQQMNIGWTSHTVIGTATEVATYINNEFIEQFNSEIVQQVEEKLKNSSLTPSQKKATIQLARMKLLTNSTAEALVRENMGNLTHHDLPCSFFLDPENPDGPDLGFSRVTDGFASCSEIRYQGYGLFILYADCPYKGIHPHGSPAAKDPHHPDHDPDQPAGGVLRTPFEKSV